MTITSQVDVSRRAFAIGAASALAGLTIGFRWAAAQAPPSGPPVPPMIRSQSAARRLGADRARRQRHRHDRPRRAGSGHPHRHAPGRRRRARRRARAAALISGDTAQTPNEGVTAGSLAVKLGSTALGLACADARATLVGVAAKAWDVQPQAVKVEDGVMLGPAGQRMSYGEAAAKVSLSRPVDVTAKRKSPAEQKIIGTSYPRIDIPAKVFGQQVFIHDLRPAGMLFGAVARPPAYAARLVSADLAAIKAMPGVVEVVRDGSFLGVVARREEQAQAAANKLAKSAKWDNGAPLFGGKGIFDYLLTAESETTVLHTVKADAPPAAVDHTRPSTAAISRPTPRSAPAARWRSGRTASSRCGRTRRDRSRCGATSPRP